VNRLDIGLVLQRAIEMYARFWRTMLTLAVAVQVPVALFDALLSGTTFLAGRILLGLVTIVVTVIAGVVVSGMYVLLIDDVRDGRQDRTIAEYFAATTPKFGALCITAFLVGLGVFAGTLLLIVPGVILAVWWSLSGVVVMLEDARGTAAMRRSRELVRGNAWRMFGLILLSSLMAGVVTAITGAVLAGLFGWAPFAGVFLKNLAAVIAMPFSSAVPVVAYFDLTAPGTIQAESA